jgi:histone acetyltransferase (RNA polymerase elongator complex component)
MIIPIFIMNGGCPNRCVFCNERITAGDHPDRITGEQFRSIVETHLAGRGRRDTVQIAFYGGNFTGLEREYQAELLEYAEFYIRTGLVHSVRLSTRPDYIDAEKIEILTGYSVTTVELGVQSMVDDVLMRARRGHTSDDVRNAMGLLKDAGLGTGLHLMMGLPEDTEERFKYTVDEVIRLRPDTVRIHPTIVFRGTELARWYEDGRYDPPTMVQAVRLSKYALRQCEAAGISVIRVGLQMTREMEEKGTIIAGPHHPAFKSLVENSIFYDMAAGLLEKTVSDNKRAIFRVYSKDVSDFRGMKNCNIKALQKDFGINDVRVEQDPEQNRGSLVLVVNGATYTTDRLTYDRGEHIV